MGAYKVLCTLEDHKEIFRVVELPENITAADLHSTLRIVFELNGDKYHYFTVKEKTEDHRYPLIFVDDPEDYDFQMIREQEISLKNLLDQGCVIIDEVIMDEVNYIFMVSVQRRLKADREMARLVSLEGRIEDNVPWTPGEEKPMIEPASIDDLNEALKDLLFQPYASSTPTFDDLVYEDLDHTDKLFNETFNIHDYFEQKNQEDKQYPVYPPQPEKPTAPSVSDIALQKMQLFYKNNTMPTIRVKIGDKTIEELLRQKATINLYDFCKYLQLVDFMSAPDEQKASVIASAYRQDPSLLLLPFALRDEDAQDDLLLLPMLAKKENDVQLSDLSFLVYMGCATFDDRTNTLVIAKDLPALLSKITPKLVEKTNKELEAFNNGFTILVKHYGLIDFRTARDFMRKDFNINTTYIRFNQLVYWYYSSQQLISTFTSDMINKSFIVEKGIDVQKIAPLYLFGEAMYSYEPIPDFMMEQWKSSGDYLEVFTGWSYLWAFLILNGQIPKDDARDIVDNMYFKVRNGAKLEDCMEELIGDASNNKQLYFRIRIWEICLHFMLGTVMPELKGATCLMASQTPKYAMTLSANFMREKEIPSPKVIRTTHVEQMEKSIQINIGSRLFTLEHSDLPELRKICRRFTDNIDLIFILGMAYQRLFMFDEAIECFRQVDSLLNGEDPTVKNMIDACEHEDPMSSVNLWNDGIFMFR